jgi:hypothetical protein
MKMGAGFRANLFPFKDVEEVEEKAAKAAELGYQIMYKLYN